MSWNPLYIEDVNSDLPVFAEVDCVVVGGGAAGVAAATAVAEKGHRTLVIERYGFCGGGAVAGLSGTICGLFMSTDAPNAKPEQAVFGFAETFRAGLEARGGVTGPQQYGKTWTVTHDPLVWRETAEALMQDAGVRILYHCMVIGVVMEGESFRGVIVNSKSGRGLVLAKRVVDASGDGDVAHRAGLVLTKGDEGKIQNPTMIFRLGGVDVKKFLAYWGADSISAPHAIDEIIAANNSAAGGHVTQHIYGAIPPAGTSQLNKTLFTSVAEYSGFWNNYSNPEKYKGDAVKCSGNHVRQKVSVRSVLNKDTIGGYSCKQANPNGQCSDQTRRKFSHVQMDFEVVNGQWILLTAYPTD